VPAWPVPELKASHRNRMQGVCVLGGMALLTTVMTALFVLATGLAFLAG
jgi:hypothetical protein